MGAGRESRGVGVVGGTQEVGVMGGTQDVGGVKELAALL